MTTARMAPPEGRVLGIDLSSNMIDIATRNAEKRDLRNVEFLTMDAEKMDLPSNHFDMGSRSQKAESGSRYGAQVTAHLHLT